jgi:ketosteroid isomerase-like protein
MHRRTVVIGAVTASFGRVVRVDAQLPGTGRSAPEVVTEAERQFADTMARRDFAAFPNYISEEAVFLGSECNRRVLRGRPAIVAAWKAFFDGPSAPFSWSPDFVQVLDSGGLALSSGPVRSPTGELTGRFNSIWRLEADRRWRVVFDQGSALCPR